MKEQGYKDRRDESMAMKGKGGFGHEKQPSKINYMAAQKADMGRMKIRPMEMRGYPSQAMDYKY
jgi:hypothetical protein